MRHAASLTLDSLRRREGSVTAGLARRIDCAERRALALARGARCQDGRRVAALKFVAAALTVLVLERRIERGDARELLSEVGAAIGVSRGAALPSVLAGLLASNFVALLSSHPVVVLAASVYAVTA